MDRHAQVPKRRLINKVALVTVFHTVASYAEGGRGGCGGGAFARLDGGTIHPVFKIAGNDAIEVEGVNPAWFDTKT